MTAIPYEIFFIGLVLAVIFTEITGIYPGGIIVPAYFALTLEQPAGVGITVLAAVISLLIYRWLARHFILFGKRRFLLLVLIGAVLSQILFWLFQGLIFPSWDFQVIGWVIPGLLANNLEKQKFVPTLIALGAVTGMIYFLGRLMLVLGL